MGVSGYQLLVAGGSPEHLGGKGSGRVNKPFSRKENRASQLLSGSVALVGGVGSSAPGELVLLTGVLLTPALGGACFRSHPLRPRAFSVQ